MTVPVIAFLDSYRAAFSSLDLDAITRLFAYPCHVTGAGDPPTLRHVAAADEWRPTLQRVIEIYRHLGVASARIESLESAQLSPNVATATVRWRLHAGDGAPLHAFTVTFTLVLQDGRALVSALAHDERPRLAEWRASRGA